MAELEALHESDLRPAGSTSDDTALTLLVADHLASEGGLGEPIRFLKTLSERAPSIPGLGPSTTRAIEHFAATGDPDESGSNTNGAPMRVLPVGWAVPASADTKRREWTIALTRMTHAGREAITAACVMSACAAWAIEGAQPPLLAEIADLEASVVGADTNVARAVAAVHDDSWTPPADGITLDPAETVAAVLYSCRSTAGLASALRRAVSLGGDTDTVAALVGGLLGSQLSPAAVNEQLTWLDRVSLPASDRLAALATSLAKIRLAANG
jgi:ADP-ribosylglycohydrolase